ncbi:hypothetical protein JXI42_07915 [bacterium]|nr:hypothetical protein [bacterium]
MKKTELLILFPVLVFLFGFVGEGIAADSAPNGFTLQSGAPTCVDMYWNAHWYENYIDPIAGWYVRYEITRDGVFLAYTDSIAYSDCGLTSGTKYCYALRARLWYNDKWYETRWTKEECEYPGMVDPPPPPFNFVVQTGDSAAIDLFWDDSATTAYWYEIYRDGNEAEADYDAQIYKDYPLEPGSQHCYKVRSCNLSGCSDFTPTECDTAGNPPQPLPGLGSMPCKYPPFVSWSAPANVCIIFDNSGSMNEQAYFGPYNPAIRYYGYADPTKYYEYQSNVYEIITTWIGTADPINNRFSGNFLNWVSMRRIDVARRVMTGGKCLSRLYTGVKILVGEPTDSKASRSYKKYHDLNEYMMYGNDLYFNGVLLGRIYIRTEEEEISGVLQGVSERLDLGLIFFNDEEGGYVADYVGNPGANIITQIENITPSTWTTLGETYYEATLYFGGERGYFTNSNYKAHDPIIYGCEKNFIILITDGEPTHDENVPAWLKEYDSYEPDSVPEYWDDYGSEDLRDVALYARTTDLRKDWPDYNLSLFLYGIYIFGEEEDKATTLIKRACRNGGFDDDNGNLIPDLQGEWDANNDGIPDTYYEAIDGYELEAALKAIFDDILIRLDAASAVSVVTNSIKGEGNAFQAIFAPKKLIGQTNLGWIGNVQALWLDQKGNLREDTDGDNYLDVTDDYIVKVKYDGHNTICKRYEDTDGDCIVDNYVDYLPIDEANFCWNAGKKMLTRSPNTRNIKAVVPESDSLEASLETEYKLTNFTDDNSEAIKDYMNATEASADSLIQYVRGVDYPYYRNRTVDGNVWKISDIINSRPVYVSEPRERFDLLYNDRGYMEYYIDNQDRRGMLYIGGNDGVLKAFNAGRYIETGSPNSPGKLEGDGYDLGAELWGVIPFNLLPHLKWLKEPNYCHVYFIDLKLKAVDARIFTPDDTHVGGWGTLLICGQNFGGTPCPTVTGDTLSSSFMAIDITDPLNYELLWFFHDRDLRYTTTYPSMAQIDSSWYLIFGSGPTDIEGISDKNAYIFVVDLQTGQLAYKYQIPDANSCLGDPVCVDVDMDFNSDLVYFGVNIYKAGTQTWEGKMYRLNFHEDTDPAQWNVSCLIDIQRPIQSGPSISMDYYGNIWVLFGTGRYTSNSDEKDISSQYFLGIKDKYWNTGSGTIKLSDLYDVSNCEIYETDTGYTVKGAPGGEMTYPELVMEVEKSDGWYVQFSMGERVTTEPAVLGETVFFTTFKPNLDICEFGGDGRLFGVYYMTGTPEPSVQTFGKDEYLDDVVLKSNIPLGEGVPTAPTAHIGIGDQATMSIQMSTGEIFQQKANIFPQKSSAVFWRGR